MNVELLRKVQKHILEEPKRVDMDVWTKSGEPGTTTTICGFDVVFPSCGTVGCIWGWAAQLAGGNYLQLDYWNVLSIDYDKANNLFHPNQWPKKFREALEKTEPQSVEYAQVICDRIDYFIDTDGWDADEV
jgi:hypothetical protein